MSPLTTSIVEALKLATGRVNAITTEGIAIAVGSNERTVRWHIANHNKEIAAQLSGVLLCSSAEPAGYWIATDSEEILAREQHLWNLRQKHHDFISTVRAAGLGGILPKREEAA